MLKVVKKRVYCVYLDGKPLQQGRTTSPSGLEPVAGMRVRRTLFSAAGYSYMSVVWAGIFNFGPIPIKIGIGKWDTALTAVIQSLIEPIYSNLSKNMGIVLSLNTVITTKIVENSIILLISDI